VYANPNKDLEVKTKQLRAVSINHCYLWALSKWTKAHSKRRSSRHKLCFQAATCAKTGTCSEHPHLSGPCQW